MATSTRRRFRFLRELAEGGFGKVYLAEMLTGDDFSTVVAVKLLHGKWTDHDEIVKRSRDEARLLGRLRHRNIVRVEDLSSINGQCAVIMEYLEGVDLKTMLGFLSGQREYFPVRAAFETVAFVAGALNAAYNHVPLQGGEPLKLIHRDIKPSNVMITSAAEVKLLDFGTARADFETREAKTQALAFGSQAYMAPERMLGDPDTPAADIFSLGITLYELLTSTSFGRIYMRPERFEQALAERLARVDFARGLPAELHDEALAVLRVMLNYDPEDRPHASQVVEMMEVLAEDANDMGLRRFCRRYVEPAMAANVYAGDPDDPLTGSTLFEDRSNSFTTEGLPEDAAEYPPADAASELLSGSLDQPSSPHAGGGADALRSSGSERRFDTSQPATPFGAPPAFQDPPPDQIAFDAVPEPSADVPPAADEAPAWPPAADEAPAWPPAADEAPAWTPPAAASEPPTSSDPAPSGGGKKIALVALLLLLVGGGGAAAVLLGGGDRATEAPPAPHPPRARADPPERDGSARGDQGSADKGGDDGQASAEPGGEVGSDEGQADADQAADDGTADAAQSTEPTQSAGVALPTGRGGVELVLKPLGGGSVFIYNQDYNYASSWDGSGKFEANDLIEGEYWTKVTPQDGGSDLWRTVQVLPGQTCKYRLDLTGAQSWELRGCR